MQTMVNNKPFFLHELSGCAEIHEGFVNLYLTQQDEHGNAVGRRYFLFTCDEGRGLPNLAPYQTADGQLIGIMAVPGRDCILNDDANVRDKQDKLELEWAARAASLLEWTRMEVDELCSLPGEEIHAFLSSFIAKAYDYMGQKDLHERKEQRERYIQDEQNLESGLYNLAEVLSTTGKKSVGDEVGKGIVMESSDPLYMACVLVADAMNIKITLPIYLKNNTKSADPIADITDASGFRYREVILKDNWEKHPLVPMLAYYGDETKTPIALIPYKSKGFLMVEPQSGERHVITPDDVEQIQPRAIMFYRSLPSEKVTAKKLLRFGLAGVTSADWMWVVFMGVGGGLLGMLTPQITGEIFDSIIPDGDSAMLIQIGFLLFALAVTSFAFELTRGFAMQRIEMATEKDLQSAVWDRLLNLPVGFFREYSSGELAERAMGISQIRQIISGSVVNTVITSIFSVFYIIMLFIKGQKLAWVGIGILLVVLLFSLGLGFIQTRYEKVLLEKSNKISGHMFGWLSGLSKIRICGAEKRIFNNWSNLFSQTRTLSFRKERMTGIQTIFNSSINIIMSMVLYFAIFEFSDFEIAVGAFIAFNTALSELMQNTIGLSQTVLSANVIVPIYKNIQPILNELPETSEQKNNPGVLRGDIEISHINFRYDSDGPLVLKDVSFSVKQGEHVALVGPSGSGKSTLFRILLGFEQAESGQMFFDGMSLDQLDVRSVRRQLGVVLQSGQLLSGSLFENIVGANLSLTREDAMRAVVQAGMEEDLADMPMGLDTVVTEGLGTLSGGQKQRLLIARALASNPRIMFFDEATSALDNKTQKMVTDSIDRLSATRITIAHRLSTIVNCDRIVVLEHGVVTEQGTYDELMALGGTFAKMAKRQIA